MAVSDRRRASSWPMTTSWRASSASRRAMSPPNRCRVARDLPVHLRHDARAARGRQAHAIARIVTLMVAALYGTGLRPGDRFICPSSPAWGHGLWHGTLAPLALGITIGAYAGKFNAERLAEGALQDHRFTNISAAATHYRMMRNSGAAPATATPCRSFPSPASRSTARRRRSSSRRSAGRPAACTAPPRSA